MSEGLGAPAAMRPLDLLLCQYLESSPLPVTIVADGELPPWLRGLRNVHAVLAPGDAAACGRGQRHLVVLAGSTDAMPLAASLMAAGNQVVHRHGAGWRLLPPAPTKPGPVLAWLVRTLPRLAARLGRLPLRPPFRHDGGHAWWASLRGLPLPKPGRDQQAMVFEDDLPLPLPDSAHDDIRKLGNGRYSVWDGGLYFATSDGSDPANNGRRYEARIVTPGNDGELVAKALDEETFAQRIAQLAATRSAAPPSAVRRVLILISSLGPGGAERQFAYLAKGLVQRGYEVGILSLDGFAGAAGHYLPMLQHSGVQLLDGLEADARCTPELLAARAPTAARTLWCELPQLFAADVWRLAAHVAVFAPDVLHCALDKPNLLGAMVGTCLGVPRIVLSTRNVNPSHLPYLDVPWYRRWYQLTSKVPGLVLSANSHAGGEDYAAWLGLPSTAIRVVHNGLDTTAIRLAAPDEIAALRRELHVPERARLLVGVFRLSAEKRPFLWLDAVVLLRRRFPDLMALHVGLGALTDQVAARIEELGLGDCVRLLGRRQDTEVVLRAADVFLLCSEFEGIPNVLLEAQWLERPVVCTAAGGSAEAVDDGVTGLVVQAAEAEALAAACARVLGDDSVRHTMGQAGHRHVEARFAVRRMIEESELLYRTG